MNRDPLISVVMPVRRAAATIHATLHSLLAQRCAVPWEMILVVSRDDATASLLDPNVSPLVRILKTSGSYGVPQLRRDGVRQAKGEFIVITEDHCLYPDGWLQGLLDCMRTRAVDAAGGPVGNASVSPAGLALYLTRYAAFLPPVGEGPASELPGNNACYRRESLQRAEPWLQDGFWEAELNHKMLLAGGQMWISPNLAVQQNQHRGAREFAALRFRHGRCYGARRIQAMSSAERWKRLVTSPMIPAVLFFRVVRAVRNKRFPKRSFAAAAPLVFLYDMCWAAGEIVGYLAGAGSSCTNTD